MDTTESQNEEYTLACRARDGDREALDQLVLRVRGALFAAAYTELRHYEDAGDAVAGALLRICRNVGSLRDPAQVRPWMLRITRNEAHRLRRPCHRDTLSLSQLDIAAPQSAAEPELSVARMDVERALRHLPAAQSAASALYLLDGLGIEEIAAHLARPTGTIKYWLSQGRSALRRRLEGYIMDTSSPVSPVTAPGCLLLASDLGPTLAAEINDAMRDAGWTRTQHVSAVADLVLSYAEDGKAAPHLAEPMPQCRCVVLDEFVGKHSAFEIATLIRSTEWGRDTALFLLADGSKGSKEFDLTVLAAYVAGFDMLLSKPFALQEFTNFLRRIYEAQSGRK
ncbi:MAG: RNA polymerase sigma factor [Armatimonadota bacterium]